jgi:predicted thioredoxin/glutaredoxin
MHGRIISMPSILFAGRLVFDDIPGPEELSDALDNALSDGEKNR